MELKYLSLSNAECIREQFDTEESFIDYLGMDFVDLPLLLTKFLEVEMYHECAIIKKLIDESQCNNRSIL